MKPWVTGIRPASTSGRRHSRARSVSACMCGRGAAEAVVGHHDRPDVHPGGGEPGALERRRHQPAAPELAPAGDRVELAPGGASGRARRASSRPRPAASSRDGGHRAAAPPGSARAVACVALDQRGRARRSSAGASPACTSGARPSSASVTLASALTTTTGRLADARADDPDEPRDRRGVRDRRAAELGDDHAPRAVHPAFRHEQLGDLHRLARGAADRVVSQQHEPEIEDRAGAHPAHRHGHPAARARGRAAAAAGRAGASTSTGGAGDEGRQATRGLARNSRSTASASLGRHPPPEARPTPSPGGRRPWRPGWRAR